MILITLRDPIVVRQPDPDEVDPEDAFRGARWAGYDEETAAAIAARTAHLPIAAGADDRPLGWSIREVRHLRFLRQLVRVGDLAGDTRPEDER